MLNNLQTITLLHHISDEEMCDLIFLWGYTLVSSRAILFVFVSGKFRTAIILFETSRMHASLVTFAAVMHGFISQCCVTHFS